MIVSKTKEFIILRLEQKKELLSNLTSFCNEEKITAAYFSAIGAANEVTVSFYNLKTKRYEDKIFRGDVEILTITGNIALVDDAIKIHAHGSFSRRDYSVFGGLVQKLIVSATCEVHLTRIKGTMKREFDEKTGLYLLEKS